MAAFGRVVFLLSVDILAIYAMYVMMAYLTTVWGIGFTSAAAIVNAFWGAVLVGPLFLTYVADAAVGKYWVLLISTVSYAAGLGLLTMSTPPVLANRFGNCDDYKPECVGHGQRVLFYIALPLIAVGMSGHLSSFNAFLADQFGGEDMENLSAETFWRFFIGVAGTIFPTAAAVIALPYIRPWSLRFGIPAICSLVATLLFLSGSCSYNRSALEGSPITTFVRVFVAATLKLLHRAPRNPLELYEIQNPEAHLVPHTKSLRCLDKAAILVPSEPREEQEKNRWRLCTVTQVEETKTIIRMIPVWMTFILCGVVWAIGFTYFVEQLEHLDRHVGKLKLPIVVLLWIFGQSQSQFGNLYIKFATSLGESGRKYAPSIGIGVSMILAVLCCIAAAKVESRRLGIVEKHGLVDKPDETVPMSMFWLLPQFVLLGGFSGVFTTGSVYFFADQSPVSTVNYIPFFVTAVFGIGNLFSVLSVYVVGKVSERGGKANWFQHDMNASRMDKYYWTLSWLMAVNLAVFVVVAALYRYNESRIEEEALDLGGIEEPYQDNTLTCCCCCR